MGAVSEVIEAAETLRGGGILQVTLPLKYRVKKGLSSNGLVSRPTGDSLPVSHESGVSCVIGIWDTSRKQFVFDFSPFEDNPKVIEPTLGDSPFYIAKCDLKV